MSATPPTNQRVSTLIGDRLCIKCGYNLTGQAIIRESHYDMLIVRCPECGTVASIQEYPLLGRWANRWAALLAALWMLVLLAMIVGTGATIFGFGVGIAEEGSSTYVQFLSTRYQQAYLQSNPGVQRWSSSEYETWRANQDLRELFAQAGGWHGAVNWKALWIGVPFGLVAFAEGCFWAVMLLGSRAPARLVVGALVLVIASMFALLVILSWHNQNMIYWADARLHVGQPLLIGSVVFGGVALGAGMSAGRPLVRRLVQILLPPRLCQSLSILWIAEGLNPPKPR